MRAQFVTMEWENTAHTIASFYFMAASGQPPYQYEAGQYAVIVVPHAPVDVRGDSRTMTLSSSPSQDLLKVTMKIYPTDGSSFKRALLQLKPNDEITIYDSMGDLILPLDASIPLVFVAGGVGIASYVGMVQYLLDTDDARDITLLYTLARPEDIVLQVPFDTYTSRFGMTKILFSPQADHAKPNFSGEIIQRRLTSKDIADHYRPTSQIYLSGVETMVEQFRSELEFVYSIPRYQIAFDYFDGYSEL